MILDVDVRQHGGSGLLGQGLGVGYAEFGGHAVVSEEEGKGATAGRFIGEAADVGVAGGGCGGGWAGCAG